MNDTDAELFQKRPKTFLPQSRMGLIAVALSGGFAIFLVYMVITQNRSRDRGYMRNINELVNLHTIGQALHAYAADHHGVLPDHVVALHDAEFEYIPAEDADEYFISPFDEHKELRWTAFDDEIPTDWYWQGSYRFYPTSGLHEDDISDASRFVLAYGSSQGDPPRTAVLFFDGCVSGIAEEELDDLLAWQHELLIDQE